MKRNHERRAGLRARRLELLPLEDDEMDPPDTGIDALLRDGGHLAACILDHLRRRDTADVNQATSVYLR